ncbi:MAG: TldD/PmbA family protein, partial [Spirochaetota bacterium]
IGSCFGNHRLNVIDDGGIPFVSGYIPLDDEGIKPQKTYLIKEGCLNARLHSRETAYHMNEEPTGNARAIPVMSQPIVRMTNTYIENGHHTRDEIFSNVDDGIYAVDAYGGQTNLEMFTFSSAYGRIVKDGKPGRMVKNVMLSGNVFETLKNIEMIGNDLKLFGGLGGCGKGGQSPLPVSFGGPHMLINDVLIGGTQ